MPPRLGRIVLRLGAFALALTLTLVGISPAHAGAPLVLRGHGTDGTIDHALEHIEPPDDPRDAAAVAALPGHPMPVIADMRGHQVLWARVTVVSDRDATGRWFLAPDRGWAQVTLYEDTGGLPVTAGIDVALRERPVAQARAILPFILDPGRPRTLLLRFEADVDTWEAPVQYIDGVESQAEAVLHEQRGQLVLGLYAGLLLAVTFVNLLFGRILRDRVYIDYVLYAVPYAMIWLAREGVGSELLWPEAPRTDNMVLFVTICAAIVFGNRFAVRFLDLRGQLPWFHRALLAVNVAVGVCVVLGLAGMWRPVDDLLGIAALVTCLLYLVAGALLTWRGQRTGRFFLIATGTLAIGTIIYTLRTFTIIPPWPMTEYSAQIGSAAEMLLLALALADRVRISERERRAAEARLREGLEREVAARTTELATINDRLVGVNRRLEALSLTDPLTGVANRRRFEVALEDEWRRAQRDSTPLALMMVDVDLFKAYNDAHGHQAGDECLRQVAGLLAEGTRRAGDQLSRYGGEEFVLIFPSMDEDAAMAHADRLRLAVADARLHHARSPVASHVTISLGVAVAHPTATDDDPEVLLARADDALYRAKRAGRDQAMLAPAGPLGERNPAEQVEPALAAAAPRRLGAAP